VFLRGVAVTVAEHTSICTVCDFTIHPVSVHLPLTRLLASLYILLEEPVEVSICAFSLFHYYNFIIITATVFHFLPGADRLLMAETVILYYDGSCTNSSISHSSNSTSSSSRSSSICPRHCWGLCHTEVHQS